MWHKWNWPPSKYIMPLYVGMHYTDNELAQHYYRQASLVAGRESGALELVVADTPDNDLAISYFANQDKLDELSEQLTNMAQCKVRVTFRKIDGREEVHYLSEPVFSLGITPSIKSHLHGFGQNSVFQ